MCEAPTDFAARWIQFHIQIQKRQCPVTSASVQLLAVFAAKVRPVFAQVEKATSSMNGHVKSRTHLQAY
jgi:hypothetical protein